MFQKRILLTNDDGIDAEGIKLLEKTLEGLGELFIVAPLQEQSGSSHSLTIGKPVHIDERDSHHVAISGTPTDCVLLAHHSLMEKTIDLVVSGINHGYNLADDVLYSGTVAAAMEGRLLRYPAVAVSCPRDISTVTETSLKFIRQYCEMVLQRGRPSLSSINLPQGEPKGARATRLGKRIYKDVVNRTKDANGEWHLILSGELSSIPVEGGDTEAVDSCFISVTPLHLDLTGFEEIDDLREDLDKLSVCKSFSFKE
ncbi:5'/3'-nucleotidase SurE [candidate division WOR-3 bacterium]|nr:5'/3'-nucleotidase SurE [candidate division WOR-3 bacterium]